MKAFMKIIRICILKFFSLIRKCINLILFPNIGVNKGKNVNIRQRVFFDRPWRVYIGDNSFINRGCEFHIGGDRDTQTSIRLGKNVFLGMNVSLICVSHHIGLANKRAGENTYLDINIGDGCWIGANSTILQGVTIAPGAIVAAGSVVVKDIPANMLVGGYRQRTLRY